MRVMTASEPRAITMTGELIGIMALLLPVFLEAIDDGRFLVTIPGSPLSLGKLMLVGVGLWGLLPGWKSYATSPAARGIALLAFGCCVGALFSDDVLNTLSRTMGLILLLVAAIGAAGLWGLRPFRTALDAYIVLSLVYWLAYTVWTAVTTGGASYTLVYVADPDNVKNHHIPGLYISVCAVYTALRFFVRDGRMRLGGFFVFGVALAACLYLESRSNLGFTAVALALTVLHERRRAVGRVFWALPLLGVIYLGLGTMFESSEGIQRRFEETSQTQATDSRTALFTSGVEAVIAEPLGRGLLDTRVEYANRTLAIHNQYVTYGVAGGVLALIGCFLWQWDYLRILLGARPRKRTPIPAPFRAADALALLVMYASLLTLEFTGMLFFLLLSLGIYRSGVASAERRLQRAERAARRRPPRASERRVALPPQGAAIVNGEAYL